MGCLPAGGRTSGGESGAASRRAVASARIAFFTHWGGEQATAAQQQALDLFQQENPGVTVEMTTGAAAADKIITAITGCSRAP